MASTAQTEYVHCAVRTEPYIYECVYVIERFIFRRVRKIAKNDSSFLVNVRLSVSASACTHGITRIPMNGPFMKLETWVGGNNAN
jgi:hypothetical protein